MIEQAIAIIPVVFKPMSIFTLIVFIGLLIYVELKNRSILIDICRLAANHTKLKDDFEEEADSLKDNISTLKTDIAEIKVTQTSVFSILNDIKDDIREIRNKIFK